MCSNAYESSTHGSLIMMAVLCGFGENLREYATWRCEVLMPNLPDLSAGALLKQPKFLMSM